VFCRLAAKLLIGPGKVIGGAKITRASYDEYDGSWTSHAAGGEKVTAYVFVCLWRFSTTELVETVSPLIRLNLETLLIALDGRRFGSCA